MANKCVRLNTGMHQECKTAISKAWIALSIIIDVTLGAISTEPTSAAPPAAPITGPSPSNACTHELMFVQECIATASGIAMRTRDVGVLVDIAAQLRAKASTDTGPSLHYRTYWLAYADFRLATLALGFHRTDQARIAILEADRLLGGIASKDQETYALHSIVAPMLFAVLPQSEMGNLIAKSGELRGKLANPTSLRALYALALADFYTPKEFGGGRLGEKLVRQALSLPEEQSHPLKPTWGRDDCAALLIRILRGSGRGDEAASLLAEWIRKAPDSIALGQLAMQR